MERNPVSVLMEHAQTMRVEAEFRVLKSFGASHQPKFLCQWIFDKKQFPATFSSSKKIGKQKSAELTLEGLRLREDSPRQFVLFVSENLPTVCVEQRSTIGIEPRYFMGEPFTSTVEALVNGEQDRVVNSEAIRNKTNPQPPKPLPRSPLKAAETSPKKMQAFDDETIAALANRNGAYITIKPTVSPVESSLQKPNESQQPTVPPRRFLPSSVDQSSRQLLETQNGGTVAPPQQADDKGHIAIAPQAAANNGFASTATDLSLDITNALNSLNMEPTIPTGVKQTNSSSVKIEPSMPSAALRKYVTAKPENPDKKQGPSPVSTLYELGQKIGERPSFTVLRESGPPHQKTFVCNCSFGKYSETVSAPSKDAGKTLSFGAVFEKLKNEPPQTNGVKLTPAASNGVNGNGVEKNPISAVMELGNRLNILPSFECEQLSVTPLSRFKGYCIFGDQRFGPAVEQNKKKAKTAAFLMALEHLKNNPFVKSELTRRQLSMHSSDQDSLSSIVPPSGDGASGRTSPVSMENMQHTLSNKHPISAFLEYAQGRHYQADFIEVSDSGPAHCRKFEYRCVMNGELFPIASARTKKEARKHAAELALRSLAGAVTPPEFPDQSSVEVPKSLRVTTSRADSPPASAASLCDVIVEHVIGEFTRLKSTCSVDLGKVILASFVLEDSSQGTYSVISIGTGNKCLTGENLSTRGTSINDCHAEVIARRGLLRYLYKEVEKHKKTLRDTIFKSRASQAGRLILKSRFKFHLYISTAPCGDGALFTHSEMNTDNSSYSMYSAHAPLPVQGSQGFLRSKMEVGEGTIPTTDSPGQTFDGICGGDRLKTMSCSDKICKWNVLGLQGTLLSDFMEPVYIDTIVIGQLFHAGHLCRALCCRVKGVSDKLTAAHSVFDVHHPRLGTPSQTLPRSTAKSKPVSINWMMYDDEVELLTAETGQVISAVNQPLSGLEDRSVLVSRLCKKRLYDVYNRLKGIEDNPPFYSDAKLQVQHYSTAKKILYNEFKLNGFGNWLCKPVEQNLFR